MKKLLTLFVVTGLILCGFSSSAVAEETITLMTHDSFNISKDVLHQFEETNNV